ASMRDEEMGGFGPLRAGNDLAELIVHGIRIVGSGQAEALRNAEDVSVDREGRNAKRVAQHDVGGLAPHPWKRGQLFQRLRDLSPMPFDERPAHADHRASLRLEESRGVNFALERGGLALRIILCGSVALE